MSLKWVDLTAAEQMLVRHHSEDLWHLNLAAGSRGDANGLEVEKLSYVRLQILWDSMQEGGVYIGLSVNVEHNDECYLSASETPIPADQCLVGIHTTPNNAGYTYDWIEAVASFKTVSEAEYCADPDIQREFKVDSTDPILSKVLPWILSLILYPENGGYQPYPASYQHYMNHRESLAEKAPNLFKVLSDALHDKLKLRRENIHNVQDESAVSKLTNLLKS